jgi:PAS domain-containing protein
MAQRPVEIILTRQLAESLSAPLFVVDPEGLLVFYNEPAEAILGRRYEEAGEMSVAEFDTLFKTEDFEGRPIASDELPISVALRKRLPSHGRFRMVGLDGVARSLEATAIPLAGQGGRLLGVMAVLWELPAL